MKTLVAATCVALLAAVGHYFWNEYAEAQARAEQQNRAAVHADCRRALNSAKTMAAQDFTDRVTMCLLMGAITESDLDAAVARATASR